MGMAVGLRATSSSTSSSELTTAEWKDADELTAALAAGYLSDEVVTTMLPVAQAIHDDPGGFIRELPDWRDFPGIDGLGPLDLPIDAAWRHLVR